MTMMVMVMLHHRSIARLARRNPMGGSRCPPAPARPVTAGSRDPTRRARWVDPHRRWIHSTSVARPPGSLRWPPLRSARTSTPGQSPRPRPTRRITSSADASCDAFGGTCSSPGRWGGHFDSAMSCGSPVCSLGSSGRTIVPITIDTHRSRSTRAVPYPSSARNLRIRQLFNHLIYRPLEPLAVKLTPVSEITTSTGTSCTSTGISATICSPNATPTVTADARTRLRNRS